MLACSYTWIENIRSLKTYFRSQAQQNRCSLLLKNSASLQDAYKEYLFHWKCPSSLMWEKNSKNLEILDTMLDSLSKFSAPFFLHFSETKFF